MSVIRGVIRGAGAGGGGGGAVDSVNGQTGTVVLTAASVGASSKLTAATLTLPAGEGVTEHTQVIVDVAIVPTDKLILSLAPALDSDDNAPETLSLETLTAVAGTGQFTVTASFGEFTSGVIKFYYQKG